MKDNYFSNKKYNDYPVVNAEGNVIGKVTSGTMSPMKKIGIGLAYVDKPLYKVDSEIFIQIRNKTFLFIELSLQIKEDFKRIVAPIKRQDLLSNIDKVFRS